MPHKRIEDKRRSDRKRYARKVEEKRRLRLELPDPEFPEFPDQAIADWCRARLRVPWGHPNERKPLELPDYGQAFIRDIYDDQFTEVSLMISRKSAKTTILGILLLAAAAADGPVRRRGFRACVCSLSREKAGELRRIMKDIADVSGLKGLKCLRSPAPGRIESAWAEIDILSTETGANSGSYDLALADELGIYPARARVLVASLRSSVSAKNGKFVSASIVGHSDLTQEIIDRSEQGDSQLSLHLFQAKKDAPLDDPEAWKAASPAIKYGIKSLKYYKSESRRVKFQTADQQHFRAYDLNQRAVADSENLVSLDSWEKCVVADEDVPVPSGPCHIGLDMGSGISMTCVAIFYEDTGLLEVIGGFPEYPSLRERGEADNCDYVSMQDRGELILSGQRSTDPGILIQHGADRIREYRCQVIGAAADLYRKGEVLQAMADAKVRWRMDWRRSGAGISGHEDCRYFVKAVVDGAVVTRLSLLMREAIRSSAVRYDENRNPSLSKKKSNSRVDALAASILSIGAAYRAKAKPKPRRQVISISLDELETMSA